MYSSLVFVFSFILLFHPFALGASMVLYYYYGEAKKKVKLCRKNASRPPNKCHIMEMDRNREIYVYGSGKHINVNMDFKRFSDFFLPILFHPLL